MSVNRARVGSIGRAPSWPQRLIVAHLDGKTGILRCGFEGGYSVWLPLRKLELATKPRIFYVAPDEFGSGIVFFREDGSADDCGADLILHLVNEDKVKGSPVDNADNLAQRVAGRLVSYRRQHNLAQREMAKRLGMAPSNYHRLESGRRKPTAETLLRVADAMGIPLGRLVSAQ